MRKVLIKEGTTLLAVDTESIIPVGVGKQTNLYKRYEEEFRKGRVQLTKLGEFLDETMTGQAEIKWEIVKTGIAVTLGDEQYLLVYFGGDVQYTYEDTFYFNHYLLPILEAFNTYLGAKVTYTEEFLTSVETRFRDGYISQYKLHKLLAWLKDEVYVDSVQDFTEGMAYVFGDLIGEDYVVYNNEHYIQITYPGYLEESIYLFMGDNTGSSGVDIRQVNHRCKINSDMVLEVATTKIINVFIGYYLVGVKSQRERELPKNRVSYALGKPIILMHREKMDYHKEVQNAVEAELTTYTSYVRTNYKHSNTTSSIYLEIKFKNCPNLYISIRDHEGIKDKKYDAIYVRNRDLRDLGSKIRPIVDEHIKNTKYI